MTGERDPEAAARAVLSRPGAKTEWCVVKEGSQGALLLSKTAPGVFQARALKVGEAAGEGGRGGLVGKGGSGRDVICLRRGVEGKERARQMPGAWALVTVREKEHRNG